jgi:hypothetical protein
MLLGPQRLFARARVYTGGTVLLSPCPEKLSNNLVFGEGYGLSPYIKCRSGLGL